MGPQNGGVFVLLRAMLVTGIAVACAGCSGDSRMGSGFAASPVTSALAAPSSGQVLAAMALERVTGLKPDPARLLASN
jgi:hypothetical protein